MLTLLFDLDLDATLLAKITASNVADRFHIAKKKGRIAVGCDADFVLVDSRGDTRITRETLHYKHKYTPYLGRTLRGKIVRTILRGQTVALDGKLVGEPRGRLLTPEP